MYRVTSDWLWNMDSQNYLIYYPCTYPPRPKFGFYLHRMTSDCLWTSNGKKFSVYMYTKYLIIRPKFCFLLLYGQLFSRYRTFYDSPLTTMLSGHKKRMKKKMPKIQNLNFTILLTTLVETMARSIHVHDVFGANLVYSFGGDVVWNFYSHVVTCWRKRNKNGKNPKFEISQLLVDTLPRSMYDFIGVNTMCTVRGHVWFFLRCGPMLQKKIIKNFKFWKTKKVFGDDGQVVFPYIWALIRLTISEKTCFTDRRTNGRTPDARVTTVALLCSSTK